MTAVLLAGCPDSEEKSATPPDDINVVWELESQTCDGAPLDAGSTLSYRLDKNYVVRVDVTSDTASEHCRTAFAYSQIVDSATEGPEYKASATLTAAGTKKQCWMVQNGMRIEPPKNEVGMFGPETIGMKIVATAHGTVELELTGAPRCKTGTLRVALMKR